MFLKINLYGLRVGRWVGERVGGPVNHPGDPQVHLPGDPGGDFFGRVQSLLRLI